MYDKHENKIKLYSFSALMLCLIMVITTVFFSPLAIAAPITSVPVIQEELTTDTTRPVVLINGSSQTGFATLKDAMTAIGSNDGDYIIVFVQDYNMVLNDDMKAVKENATGNSVSLSITSSFFVENDSSNVQQTKTFSMRGDNTTGYNFSFNADTTIHDCVFDVYGLSCSHMFGNGHNFTIGDNVVVNNMGISGRIQLYGGGDVDLGTAANPATTNLVINSGNFAYAMAGNRSGIFTGDAIITVQGTAAVTNLYAASQSAAFGAGSTSTIIADGSNGASFSTIAASYGPELPADTSVSLTLINAADFGVVDLNTHNNGTSNVLLEGDFNHVAKQLLAGDMQIADGTTLRLGSDLPGTDPGTTANYGGKLTIKGDLTLGADSSYIHAGISAQSIGGDLIVNGDGAAVQLFKESAASSSVAMTIAGSYFNTDHRLNLSIWNDVAPKDQDVFLTYANAGNADSSHYYANFVDPSSHTSFTIEKNEGNIVCSKMYEYPSYYVMTSDSNLFSYTEVGNLSNTSGDNRTVYRKYVYNDASNIWEVFDADENGTCSGTPIDQDAEHPQPNAEYRSDFESTKGTMIRLDEFGKYLITVAVGTNASGVSNSSTGTACGNHSSFYNLDDKGTNSSNSANNYESNASWADLKKTNSNCSIYKAYLVMTTPLRGNAGADEELLKDNLINNPMKLMYDNNIMLSNGYLPEGFVIGKAGTDVTALSSDTPTLLYDNCGLFSDLGEAMTITDVTDFVKANGYGRYYGVDIPYEGNDVDAAIAWRLIVLEEDTYLDYIRKVSLQIGPISNGNLTQGQPAAITLDLDGLTTPNDIDDETFGGQLLMIGSDNTTDPNAGGGEGSNLHNTFYPDPINAPGEFVQIASNDPSTPFIDRPLGHWSQGLMDINGVNLTEDQVSHVETNGAMGIDMSLLEMTNHENIGWTSSGGHNLYLAPLSPAIKLTSRNDPTGVGYIDVLGLSIDTALPKFESEIWHTDLCTIPAVGTDIVAGQPVIVRGSATNITPSTSAVQGSFNTHVIVKVDEKLTAIRDSNDANLNQVAATFHDYDPDTENTVNIPITGVFDPEAHTITFDFGTDIAGFPLYNNQNDSIDFVFKADTQPDPTIDDPTIQYVNTIEIWGQTIYQNNLAIQTPYARYDYDEDRFDTYINQVQIAKIVSGNLGNQNQEFTFTVLIKNSVGGHYPEGTEIDYTGGVLEGITTEKPADGTLVVNSNGEITFNLKHGQYFHFVNMVGTIEVTETSAAGYQMTWENILVKGDGEEKTLHDGAEYATGSIAIGENESRKINIYNNNSAAPPTGITLPGTLPYFLIVLICLGVGTLVLVFNRRKKQLAD